eukprot:Pgem_evm1s9552
MFFISYLFSKAIVFNSSSKNIGYRFEVFPSSTKRYSTDPTDSDNPNNAFGEKFAQEKIPKQKKQKMSTDYKQLEEDKKILAELLDASK